MKIEYIKDGTSDSPLIRIYGADPKGFSRLTYLFRSLFHCDVSHAAIQELPGFEVVGNCTLTAIIGKQDKGVQRHGSEQDFTWILTPSSWETVADLTEPFRESQDIHFHQWLAGKEARFGLD